METIKKQGKKKKQVQEDKLQKDKGIGINTSKDEDKSQGEVNNQDKIIEPELLDLEKQLKEKTKMCDEYLDMLQRKVAEFDNYKKRTIKEKEEIYTNALIDTVSQFLPSLDDLERAINSCQDDAQASNLLHGVEMILQGIKDVFSKLGVEEIQSVGQEFNPKYHDAVMHIEDKEVDNNIIVEEFQKGYKIKDKVIRYSMVKVAN